MNHCVVSSEVRLDPTAFALALLCWVCPLQFLLFVSSAAKGILIKAGQQKDSKEWGRIILPFISWSWILQWEVKGGGALTASDFPDWPFSTGMDDHGGLPSAWESSEDRKRKRRWSVKEGGTDFYGRYLWESLERMARPWLDLPCSLFYATGWRRAIHSRTGKKCLGIPQLLLLSVPVLTMWAPEFWREGGSVAPLEWAPCLIVLHPYTHNLVCENTTSLEEPCIVNQHSFVEEAATRYFETLRLCMSLLLLFQHTTTSLAAVLQLNLKYLTPSRSRMCLWLS